MFERKILLKIKQKREQLGYTQEQVAKMLGYKGKSSYNNIEQGKVKINIDLMEELFRILKFSQVEIGEIFFENKVLVSQTKDGLAS